MDPKQTSPLGAPQVGGQEGQPVQPTPAVGDVSGANSQAETPAVPATPAPVFSTGTAQPTASQKMAGDLGAENLSTGANVSRTMDSLNDAKQSATGAPIFAKHKFDKIEYATGDILLNKDDPKPKRRLFGENFSASRPKSAAEISREARREARRLRRLNKASNNGSAVEPTPAQTSTPAPKASSASPNLKVIVGIVVGILVVIAGVLGVIALTSGNKKSTSKPSSSTPVVASEEAAKEAFSDYLSFLFWGEDGEKKMASMSQNELTKEFEKVWESYESGEWMYDANGNYDPSAENPIYAEQMMESSSMTNPGRETYFEELNDKWNKFLSVYDGDLRNTPRQTDISLYFYDLAKVGNLTEDDILDIYRRNKDAITEEKNPALEEIERYVKTESENRAIVNYVAWRQKLLANYLSFIQNSDKKGCLINGKISGSCNLEEIDGYKEYLDLLLSIDYSKIPQLQRNDAIAPLENVYIEIFSPSSSNSLKVEDGESL